MSYNLAGAGLSIAEKESWAQWFNENPGWLEPLYKFYNGRPEVVTQKWFWHDLANVLVTVHMKRAIENKGGNNYGK